jgi:RNA polymerase sigma-70 factor (ECF subfamily)
MTDSRNCPDRRRISGWIDSYGAELRGYLSALTRDEHAAEDLLQDVFQRAWQARRSYREQGQARAYLFRIADHLVCDWARRGGRERTLDEQRWRTCQLTGEDQDPQAVSMRNEATGRLVEALDRITPCQQRVLLLRYFGQLSFQEIAQLMDCPLNTVLSHARRGLQALRGILDDCRP